MPAGSPWFSSLPQLFDMPLRRYWHVFRLPYGPLDANPSSKGRFALTRHASMFYVAESLAAAPWETVLRNVAPDAKGRVSIEASELKGYRAVELELIQSDVQCLHLNDPRVRHFVQGNEAKAEALKALVATPDHRATRDVALAWRDELTALGMADMPTLCWQSNQCSS